MKDYCAGCGRIGSRRDMKFVAGWLYRCDHCRSIERPAKQPDRSWVEFTGLTAHWPRRAAQLVAAAACIWAAVDTTWEANDIQHQDQQQRDHLSELRRASYSGDGPTEPSGAHFHCEQSGSLGACSWRWPDGSLAPPPGVLREPPPMSLP